MNKLTSQLEGPAGQSPSVIMHDNTLTFRDIRLRQLAREQDGLQQEAVAFRPLIAPLQKLAQPRLA